MSKSQVMVSQRFLPAKGLMTQNKISNCLSGLTFVVEPVNKDLKSKIELLIDKHGGKGRL